MRTRLALLIAAASTAAGIGILGLFLFVRTLDATTLTQVDFIATLLLTLGALGFSRQLFVLARRRDYDQRLENFKKDVKSRMTHVVAQGNDDDLAATISRIPQGPGEPRAEQRRRSRQQRRRSNHRGGQSPLHDFETFVFWWQSETLLDLQLQWSAHASSIEALRNAAADYPVPTPPDPPNPPHALATLWNRAPGYVLVTRAVPGQRFRSQTRRKLWRGYAGWFTCASGD